MLKRMKVELLYYHVEEKSFLIFAPQDFAGVIYSLLKEKKRMTSLLHLDDCFYDIESAKITWFCHWHCDNLSGITDALALFYLNPSNAIINSGKKIHKHKTPSNMLWEINVHWIFKLPHMSGIV